MPQWSRIPGSGEALFTSGRWLAPSRWLADASGREVARVSSGADGTFSVALAPGTYRLTAEPVEGLMGTPSPMDVGIEAGQPMTELTVSYDTGIR